MNVLLYGAGKQCAHLLKQIECRQKIHVIGILDSYVKGEKYGLNVVNICDSDICNLYDKDTIIIITIGRIYDAITVNKKLRTKGYRSIYWYTGKKCNSYMDLLECCLEMPSMNETILPSLEMNLVDFCNLNCVGCTHFSPLFDKYIPSFNKRFADFVRIKNLFDRVLLLSLMGGEPLLNPEITEYMEQARLCFPKTEIQLLTNGLLLPNMAEEFFYVANRYDITLVISEYQPTRRIMKKICECLNKYDIKYIIRSYAHKTVFNRPLTTQKNTSYEKCCMSDGCVAVCEGRIARCPTLLYLWKFNQYFQQSLPEEGVFTLDEFTDGHTLVSKLKKRVPLCDYCIKNEIKWHPCEKIKKLNDFAVD